MSSLPGSRSPVALVAVLVVPADTPTATYLRWLALVARMVHHDTTVEAVRLAQTPGEAHAALVGAVRAEGRA